MGKLGKLSLIHDTQDIANVVNPSTGDIMNRISNYRFQVAILGFILAASLAAPISRATATEHNPQVSPPADNSDDDDVKGGGDALQVYPTNENGKNVCVGAKREPLAEIIRDVLKNVRETGQFEVDKIPTEAIVYVGKTGQAFATKPSIEMFFPGSDEPQFSKIKGVSNINNELVMAPYKAIYVVCHLYIPGVGRFVVDSSGNKFVYAYENVVEMNN